MGPRQTWFWLIVASALFAFIVFFHGDLRKKPAPLQPILARLNPAAVTNVQVRPLGHLEIRVERTNDSWALTAPVSYPAQAVAVESLLTVLNRLAPATYITAAELKDRPQADQDFGFTKPFASVLIQQTNARSHVLVGSRTAPGDQVFLQIIGVDGVFVVDAEFLKLLPRSADDWRETAFLDIASMDFDRLTVTNSGRIFELERSSAASLWRMSSPIQARADQERIVECLEQLQALRIQGFVSDEPKTDLEPFGLQPPDLGLFFRQGTNLVARLEFGGAPTNNSSLVYARRADRPSIVTVSRDALAGWRLPVNLFRDPHLLSTTGSIASIQVEGQDQFTLRSTNRSWIVQPHNFPADTNLLTRLIETLSGMRIAQFVKDVVTEQDLPGYGFSSPVATFSLHAPEQDAGANTLLARIVFGTNVEDRVYVRRTDESSVYAVKAEDFIRLPTASWQFRERQIWDFSETNVARLTVTHQGKARHLQRNGPHDWSLSPGSQGIINDLAVEETVKGLGQLQAVEWMARGTNQLAAFGFKTNGLVLELDLKSGEKPRIEFGGASEAGFPYAAVPVDAEPWIFKFPLLLFRDVESYLAVPASSP